MKGYAASLTSNSSKRMSLTFSQSLIITREGLRYDSDGGKRLSICSEREVLLHDPTVVKENTARVLMLRPVTSLHLLVPEVCPRLTLNLVKIH